jgi:predicted TIM-barrel fold metal-dependent hydrolase
MSHPRYAGPVIDAHCHFDAASRARAAGVLRDGGLQSAIHLWDIVWPPAPFEDDRVAWRDEAPGLHRCHVPDLSTVGAPGFAEALVERVRAADAAGAVGIKVWKNLGLWERDRDGQRLHVDDERLGPLWSISAELELPVVIHTGDPPAFFAPLTDDNPRIEELRAHPDWWWGGPGYPALEQLHEQFERLVAGHPETNFIGAHFGCFMTWEEVDRLLGAYANYHVDTAAAIADMGRDPSSPVRDVIIRHADRVVFGTDLIRVRDFDMPELGDRWDLEEFFDLHWRFFETAEEGLPHPLPAQGPWTVTGLDLPDEVLEQLYFANAARLFKLGDGEGGA